MIDKNIINRKSIVCFGEKPVPDSILVRLFEAASWAPSSFNQQPWRFIIGKKGEKAYNKIFDSLTEGNRVWANNAPILLVSVAEEVSGYNNKINKYAWHDTAMAYSNLVYQATSEGMYLHPMGGYSKETIINRFEIPKGFQPIVVAALGYKGDCKGMPANVIERENSKRTRKPVKDFVYGDNWGKQIFK